MSPVSSNQPSSSRIAWLVAAACAILAMAQGIFSILLIRRTVMYVDRMHALEFGAGFGVAAITGTLALMLATVAILLRIAPDRARKLARGTSDVCMRLVVATLIGAALALFIWFAITIAQLGADVGWLVLLAPIMVVYAVIAAAAAAGFLAIEAMFFRLMAKFG